MNKSGNFRASQIFIDHILRAKRCSRRARGERAGGGLARSQEQWAIRAVERTDLGNGTGRSAGGALLNGTVGKVRCRPSRAGTPVAAWGGQCLWLQGVLRPYRQEIRDNGVSL